jgi:hypothetical protein
MGNCSASRYKNTSYEQFLNTIENNHVIKKFENELEFARTEIKNVNDRFNKLELRIARTEQLMLARYQDLQIIVSNSEHKNDISIEKATEKLNEKINEKINIITRDMESLLNNDKLLLDKLIEKNIVSTIQEDENEDAAEYASEDEDTKVNTKINVNKNLSDTDEEI